MKKIIRWLSDVSGVSRDVRKETYEEIGYILLNDRHWFGHPERIKIYNVMTLYGMRFAHKHNSPNVSIYRDKLDEAGDTKIDKFKPITFI